MTRVPEQRKDEAISRALATSNCPYCGARLDRHQAISPGHCGSPDCLATHLVKASADREEERKIETEARRKAAREDAADALMETAQSLSVAADNLVVAVVPFQNRDVVALPEERRAEFERHLDEILTRAFEEPDGVLSTLPRSDPSPEPPIVDAACAACQGMCCLRGGGTSYAFLTAQTVLQLTEKSPDVTAEQLRDDYLSALPEISVEDSCVYHSTNGCNLPRSHRAALCNRFHCHDLYALHDQTGGRGDLPLALIGVEDNSPKKIVGFNAALGGVVHIRMLED